MRRDHLAAVTHLQVPVAPAHLDRLPDQRERHRVAVRVDGDQVVGRVRVAIPRELRSSDGRALVRDFAQRAFVDRGMVADIAYHGGQCENPHAHILLTTRSLTLGGFGQKDRSWNSKELLTSWREDWAAHANQTLERLGRPERIDHRTLAVQRDEALACGDTTRAESLDHDPEIHLGQTPSTSPVRSARTQLSSPGRSSRTPDGAVVVDVAGVDARGLQRVALQVQRL